MAASTFDKDIKTLYEKSLEQLLAISEIADYLAVGNYTPENWNKILKDIVELMGANIGSIYLLDRKQNRLFCEYEYSDTGYNKSIGPGGVDLVKLYGFPIMDVLENGKCIMYDSITEIYRTIS